jgi:hypothetical protein
LLRAHLAMLFLQVPLLGRRSFILHVVTRLIGTHGGVSERGVVMLIERVCLCPELYFRLVYISFGKDRQDGQDAVVRPQTDVSVAMCINIRSRQGKCIDRMIFCAVRRGALAT